MNILTNVSKEQTEEIGNEKKKEKRVLLFLM